MKHFRSAIIGCGGIHKVHAVSLSRMDNVTYAVACDIRPERAKASAETYGAVPETDYRKVLADPSIDVVHLTLPHWLHGPVAAEALKAGKAVLVEKPMAVTVREAKALIALSEETGSTLGVIFQNRYNPASLKMKELLEAGEIGRLRAIRGRVSWFRGEQYYSDDWHGRWSTECGGVMINQAIHTLDLVQWMAGSPAKEITAHVANDSLQGVIEVEDTAHARILFGNGAIGLFDATTAYAVDDEVEVEAVGEKGNLFMRGGFLYRKDPGSDLEFLCGPDDEVAVGKAAWGSSHIHQIMDFYRSLEKGEKPWISGIEGYNAVALVCALYDSARTGQKVPVEGL